MNKLSAPFNESDTNLILDPFLLAITDELGMSVQ